MSTVKTKNIQHPTAAAPALVLNTDGSFDATMNDVAAKSLNGSYFSFRNKLINGSFDIWQRGTTFDGSLYTADRWKISAIGGASNRVFGPDGVTDYAIQLAQGGASLEQFIELPVTGRASEYQVGTTWVLSWYQSVANVVASKSIQFMDSSTVDGGSTAMQFSTPVVAETVGTWTRYKCEVTITETPEATSECLKVTVGNNGNANTQYTGFQLEKGGLTTFERRPLQTELALCQRYYQFLSPGVGFSSYWYDGVGTQYLAVITNNQTPMRAAPTLINATQTCSSIFYTGTPGSSSRSLTWAASLINRGDVLLTAPETTAAIGLFANTSFGATLGMDADF